jgi:hypothetical protein
MASPALETCSNLSSFSVAGRAAQEGQRVFVNYDFDKRTQVGFWYEAVVEAKPAPRRKTFTATVKMEAEAHEDCQVQLQF